MLTIAEHFQYSLRRNNFGRPFATYLNIPADRLVNFRGGSQCGLIGLLRLKYDVEVKG